MNAPIFAAVAALVLCARPAVAGLDGQPAPSDDVAARILKANRAILGAGDPARARPELFLAVESEATADLTELLAPVVLEDPTYRGLVSVFTDAVADADDPKKALFARYNLARIHLLRALALDGPARRRAPLAAAAAALTGIGTSVKDIALIEMQGDIESLRGNVDQAVALYARLTPIAGTPAPALYRTGLAYRRAGRLDDAVAAFDKGLKSDRGGRLWRHLCTQGLGWVALDRGKLADAAAYLLASADAAPDDERPYALRTDLARALLAKGQRAAVLDYARKAERRAPRNPDILDLLRQAEAGGGR